MLGRPSSQAGFVRPTARHLVVATQGIGKNGASDALPGSGALQIPRLKSTALVPWLSGQVLSSPQVALKWYYLREVVARGYHPVWLDDDAVVLQVSALIDL